MEAEIPMTGPLLRISELSPKERALFEHDIARRLTSVTPTPAFYLGMFHSWGIMCPHPMDSRLYDGFYRSDGEVPFEDHQWYRCSTCQCIVINRE